MLAPETFGELIGELRKTTQYLTFYFQGEPYLHPEFTDLVRIATFNRIITSTSTNAHFLTPENAKKTVDSGLHRLVVSIDGTTQEVYEKYRVGGSLDKSIQGVKEILTAKQEANSRYPIVELQFVVFKHNEHQIQEVKELGKSLEVDTVSIKTAQIYDYKEGHDLIPENEQYSRYRKERDGSYSIKSKLKNNCWKMWSSTVITWDGKVVPCCFDKDAKYTMGNVQEIGFKTVWKSPPYQQFRTKILASRKSIDICQNCTEGLSIFAE
jgi:radical SAM protein with 4Fe4S-binding SPASM domain